MALGSQFEEVLAGARRGEHDAFVTLYRELAPAVLGYLRAQRAVEPEDVASEVFVSLVKGVGGFRGDEPAFRSWVFTIAHRRLVDERRRLARRREDSVAPERLPGVAGPASYDVHELVLGADGSRRVLELLGELTDDQRSVVLLRVLGDLPVRDVARAVGKREGAVKTLQRRALARLGALLADAEAVAAAVAAEVVADPSSELRTSTRE